MTASGVSAGLILQRLRVEGGEVVIDAEGDGERAECPRCGTESAVVHGTYRRRPLDLPWRGWTVRLQVRVRRFRCGNPDCPRETFAEPLGEALPRYAHRTLPTDALLLQFAQAAGGEGGARLAKEAGVPSSPDTLRRLLRASGEREFPTPRVLGVDDFAFRRGVRYGTILVDLEAHHPIDLLADREAATLAQWLQDHPGVEIIARDRATAYAEGAKLGAPEAEQVADRFHLAQNASQALEELLRGRPRQVTAPVPPPTEGSAASAPPPVELLAASPRQRQATAAARRRRARWEEVHRRRNEGQGFRRIARELGISRHTVHRELARPAPLVPTAPPRPSGLTSPTLAPFVPYLEEQWAHGCTNISQLLREIRAQGYQGSYSLLNQALRPFRPPRDERTRRARASDRPRYALRWLCLRPPERLSAEERAALEQALADDEPLRRGYQLLQRFRELLRTRDLDALEPWLVEAEQSSLPSFQILAHGIRLDRAAVDNALRLPWSTGPVEGHNHRLKLLKRQGYGRAKRDLLRARVVA
jgi:transposase